MKRLVLIFLAIVQLISLSGCDNVSEEELPSEAEFIVGNEIINLQMREPDTLDPLLTKRQSVRDALLTVYEPLFNIDEKFGLQSVLAQSYAFNDNATVMTLKIKEGVFWHNGQPFTSDDVVYTVNRIKEDKSCSYYLNLESVDRVEKLNDYELVFYLNRSDSFLLYSLYFPIVRTMLDVSQFPVGTGAYMTSEVDSKSLNLVKNPNWHMGEAECDGVKFLYMRTGAMAQEAFSSGKIHAVTKDMLDIENFAIKESYVMHVYPNALFEFIGFNSTEGLFADPLMRIAVSNAVNRTKIGELFGGGVASGFPIMPGSSAVSPAYEISEYNLDYAKEVIFSSGWMDMDYDTKPEKVIDGKIEELKFTLLVADGDNLRKAVAEEIKDELEQADFTVAIEWASEEVFIEKIENGEYDAFLGAVYYDDPYDVSDILSSDGILNYHGYDSPDMDLVLSSFAAATDAERVSVAFTNLQSLYTAHQPIAGLVFRTTYVVTSNYIEGEISPYPYSPYANIAKWNLVGRDIDSEDL